MNRFCVTRTQICFRYGTRTDGPPSTTTGAKMLLHFYPVGVTLSWEEAHPGARASRPHKSSRSFTHLLHRNQPAAAPCLCFDRAPAVPAGRAVGCNIAGKLSGNPRDSMRAGRPRSQVGRPDGEVGGIRRATSLKAGLCPLGTSRLPASRAPAPHGGADHPRVKQQIFLTYREQGPCPVNPDFRIIQHGCTGCTGLTGRAAGAQDADWLNNGLKS